MYVNHTRSLPSAARDRSTSSTNSTGYVGRSRSCTMSAFRRRAPVDHVAVALGTSSNKLSCCRSALAGERRDIAISRASAPTISIAAQATARTPTSATDERKPAARVFRASGKVRNKRDQEGKIKRALAGALNRCPSSQKSNVVEGRIMWTHIGVVFFVITAREAVRSHLG